MILFAVFPNGHNITTVHIHDRFTKCCHVLVIIFIFLLSQEPCIEEHCHDSWFPGTSLLSNLHHVINYVRVRVPETAPEVERKRERERERETPPSTSSESSTFGQVSHTVSGVLVCEDFGDWFTSDVRWGGLHEIFCVLLSFC